VTLPAIASVEPSEAMPGQTLNVTINGSGFDGATAVSFGPGLVIKGFVVNSSIQIVAEITVGNTAVIGPRDVSVSTNVGVGTQPQGFAVIPLPDMTPDIEDMNPVAGLPGEDIQVVITGGNFTGATAISFGDGVTVRSFTVDSDTQISATISISRRAETGSRDVTVTTPEGTETLPGLFSIEVPPTSVPMYVWLLAGFGAAAVLLGLAGVLVWRKKLAH
jgi:large repetitive protein